MHLAGGDDIWCYGGRSDLFKTEDSFVNWCTEERLVFLDPVVPSTPDPIDNCLLFGALIYGSKVIVGTETYRVRSDVYAGSNGGWFVSVENDDGVISAVSLTAVTTQKGLNTREDLEQQWLLRVKLYGDD